LVLLFSTDSPAPVLLGRVVAAELESVIMRFAGVSAHCQRPAVRTLGIRLRISLARYTNETSVR